MHKSRAALLATTVLILGCGSAVGNTTPSPSVNFYTQSAFGQPSSSPATALGPGSPAPLPSAPEPSTPIPSVPVAETPSAPTATPTPDLTPYARLLVNGHSTSSTGIRIVAGKTVNIQLRLKTRNLDQGACLLRHTVEPDAAAAKPVTRRLKPLATQWVALTDGLHTFKASCPSARSVIKVRAIDGQPERCAGFTFPPGDVSVATLAELKAGIAGTWRGCVTTPWLPAYFVTITLRADGTYSAVSGESLDWQTMNAMYYGTEEESPAKRYWLNDLQDDLEAIGEIDIVFSAGSVNRDELRNIRLMDNRLEFEMFHQGVYGPLTFQLYRANECGC
jgi:hypothetical protein